MGARKARNTIAHHYRTVTTGRLGSAAAARALLRGELMKLSYAFSRAAAVSVLGFAAAFAAQAVPVAFSCTTNNSGRCASVVRQIALDIADLGGGWASFSFSNTGPIGSTLTDIYWRGASLTGGGAIVVSGAGVSFSWGASPHNPGGGIP